MTESPPVPPKLLKQIAAANDRLTQSAVKVRILFSYGSIRLRGFFPDQDGVIKRRTITPTPHIPLTAIGIREAESLAHEIAQKLRTRSFVLSDFRRRGTENEPLAHKNIGEWVEAFKDHYFQTHSLTPVSRGSFYNTYLVAFRRADQKSPLTPEVIISAICKTSPDTRSRVLSVIAWSQLVKFAGLDLNLKGYRGRYKPKPRSDLLLPSRDEIILARKQLTRDVDRWIFSMLYLYGLRNHECFFVSLIDSKKFAYVSKGKTGSRQVLPCDPSLFDDWGVVNIPEFKINQQLSNAALGFKVSALFRSYDIPFRGYDLRHCYSREMHQSGANSHLVARMMGHSLSVHEKTYCGWVGTESLLAQYDRLNFR